MILTDLRQGIFTRIKCQELWKTVLKCILYSTLRYQLMYEGLYKYIWFDFDLIYLTHTHSHMHAQPHTPTHWKWCPPGGPGQQNAGHLTPCSPACIKTGKVGSRSLSLTHTHPQSSLWVHLRNPVCHEYIINTQDLQVRGLALYHLRAAIICMYAPTQS